jgi:hypothetical protein
MDMSYLTRDNTHGGCRDVLLQTCFRWNLDFEGKTMTITKDLKH